MKKQLLFLMLMMLPLVASAITEIDGIYYNLNSGTQTAEVTIQMRKKYSGDLVIPSSVTYNGVEYSVTKIEGGAFYYDPVKDLYLYAEQVPEATELILYEYHAENATLHVPATAVEAYKNAEYWKDFGSIVALTDSDPNPTGIKSVSNSAKAIERYYTIDGKLLSTPQRGLNIIKMSDGKTRKVVIK